LMMERKEIVASLPLLMKIEEEAVSCWGDHRRCWWRLKRKPWAIEEIIAAVDEKKAATMSIDDWSEEREGVKTGRWPWLWPWLSPLLWLPVG
jgi:hypothetical protein